MDFHYFYFSQYSCTRVKIAIATVLMLSIIQFLKLLMCSVRPIGFPKFFNHRKCSPQLRCKKSSYDLSQSAIFNNSRLTKQQNSKFGTEKRFSKFQTDLKMHSQIPCPGSYQIQDGFKSHRRNKNNSTLDRQQKLIFKDNHVPGPGKYQLDKYNPEVSLSYTMRSRVPKDNAHWNLAGPGQYNLKGSLSTIGTHNQGPSIRIGKQKRFNVKDNQIPSPNTYNTGDFMNKQTSIFDTANKYSFGKASKVWKIKTEVPGPGSYQQFSEFQPCCQVSTSRY